MVSDLLEAFRMKGPSTCPRWRVQSQRSGLPKGLGLLVVFSAGLVAGVFALKLQYSPG